MTKLPANLLLGGLISDQSLNFNFQDLNECVPQLFCHTRLHLGYSARLRIWQVPTCKMEPRSGIIVLINHPTTHPPAGQTCHQDCAMSPICTLNNKFALSPPLLLTHLGILCGVPTIACVIRVVQCPPTCTLKNKCVVGVCGVPPSPALQTSKYFVRCPPSYFSNILVVSLTQF